MERDRGLKLLPEALCFLFLNPRSGSILPFSLISIGNDLKTRKGQVSLGIVGVAEVVITNPVSVFSYSLGKPGAP